MRGAMTLLSPEEVLYRVVRVSDADDEAWILRKANDHPHKFLPTVVSFWRQQGRVLSPVIEQQLSLHAQRLAAYDDLVTELRHSDSLVRELRGSLIRSLYPSGLIRQQ